jgi:hypothetical protein
MSADPFVFIWLFSIILCLASPLVFLIRAVRRKIVACVRRFTAQMVQRLGSARSHRAILVQKDDQLGSARSHASTTKPVGAFWFQHEKVDAHTLRLKSKMPDITCVVPSDARIVDLIPGDKADLVPGTQIFIPRWEKRADGTWEATVAIVGRDDVAVPK